MRRLAATTLRKLAATALCALLLALTCAYPVGSAWAEPAAGGAQKVQEQIEKDEATAQTVTLPDHVDEEAVDDEDQNRINPQQQPDSSFIYDVSIADLANADPYMDGQTVQVTGEAVGDILHSEEDSDYCWVVVASSDRGISGNVSVYMRKAQAKAIDILGRYGTTGTTLQVRGKFNLVCSKHAGVSDVHADFVTAVEEGSSNPDKWELSQTVPGIALIVAGALLLALFRMMQERSR